MRKPGNFQTLLFFIGFILLFFLVFALGVIVGKGLTDFESLLSQKNKDRILASKEEAVSKLEQLNIIDKKEPDAPEKVAEQKTGKVKDFEEKEEAVTIIEETPEKESEQAVEITADKKSPEKEPEEVDKKTTETQSADKPESGTEPKTEEAGKKEDTENYVAKLDYSMPEFPKTDPGGKYTIQLGSFQNIDTAYRLEKSLNEKGYPSFVIKAVIPEKGTWYRVRVGTFNDKKKAVEYAEKLKSKEKLEFAQITLNN